MVHKAYCPPIAGTVRSSAAAPSAAASTPSAVRVRMASAAAEGPAVDDEVRTAPAKVMAAAAEAGDKWNQARADLIKKLQDESSDIHIFLLDMLHESHTLFLRYSHMFIDIAINISHIFPQPKRHYEIQNCASFYEQCSDHLRMVAYHITSRRRSRSSR